VDIAHTHATAPALGRAAGSTANMRTSSDRTRGGVSAGSRDQSASPRAALANSAAVLIVGAPPVTVGAMIAAPCHHGDARPSSSPAMPSSKAKCNTAAAQMSPAAL